MKPLRLVVTAIAALASGISTANAQSVISARSGLVPLVEGDVFLQDQKIEAKFGNFPEVKEKAVLRTADGRVEVLLNPGVFLRLGERSALRMITNRLIDTRVELLSGSALIEAAEIAKDTGVTIVCKDGAATLRKAGIYRFDFSPARLRVRSGDDLVQINGQHIKAGAGKMIAFEGEQAALVARFDKEEADALDRWSRRRGEYVAMANVSAAKSLRDSGYSLYSGIWRWNPWFGMMTYIPAHGSFYSPYGFRYWSPATVGRVYYTPPPMSNSGWNSAASGGYQGMGATSSGYSGTMASSGSSGSYSSPAASSSSGSTSAGSSGSSSVGAGASGGGSRGR